MTKLDIKNGFGMRPVSRRGSAMSSFEFWLLEENARVDLQCTRDSPEYLNRRIALPALNAAKVPQRNIGDLCKFSLCQRFAFSNAPDIRSYNYFPIHPAPGDHKAALRALPSAIAKPLTDSSSIAQQMSMTHTAKAPVHRLGDTAVSRPFVEERVTESYRYSYGDTK